ncbi:MAG: M56 family metallopeptidase, partial [Deltaproteobacteria bacterium]
MKTLSVAIAFAIAAVAASPATSPWPVWIERLGWTLVHSVWQLGGVALVMRLVDAWARPASPRRRYLIAAATLGLMLMIPAATWLLWAPRSVSALPSATPEPTAARQSSRSLASEAGVYDPQTNLPVDLGKLRIESEAMPLSAADGPSQFESRAESDVAVATCREAERLASLRVEPRSAFEPSAAAATGWIDRIQAGIEGRLEWLVWFWLAGVALFSCRPVCGICSEWRLRHRGRSPVADSVEETLRRLAQRMGITQAITIAQSAFVRVPLVIGYLRPLILLPVGALARLTPAQLEAILAHELAHIRRHDWLVNALQVLAETVLFYHPAVWWISRRVRQSRELCCDDTALELLPDRAVFARALLILEEFRLQGPAFSASTTLAATGGLLSARIRRLLPAPAGARSAARGRWSGAVLLIALGLSGGVSLLARPPAKPVEAEESED